MKKFILILFTLLCSLSTYSQEQRDSVHIFVDYEQMPYFRGGHAGFIQFIEDNMKYPYVVDCVEGRVIVEVIIEKDGTITNPKIKKSVHPLFDAEALRLVSIMPKFAPAKYRGEACRVKYYIAIPFTIK